MREKLLLFDLDGTLLLSGGAGARALDRAFLELYGVSGAFEGIKPAGKTDPMIIREIVRKHEIRGDELAIVGKVAGLYERYLADEMPISPNARMMPNVVPALEYLAARSDAILGLLTGNFERCARIKLARFDLNRFFAFGAYASDSEVRAELVPIAVAKAEEHTGRAIGLGPHVFVIGDTPMDVACALDNGVTSVAVATSSYTPEALTECGAHLCFDDLSDAAGFYAAIDAFIAMPESPSALEAADTGA
ncbi:haloacid dehalogenase-like hydrolase [bacterium]|nr:haloacid dehalogenase-like hydrolase [bacterium]